MLPCVCVCVCVRVVHLKIGDVLVCFLFLLLMFTKCGPELNLRKTNMSSFWCSFKKHPNRGSLKRQHTRKERVITIILGRVPKNARFMCFFGSLHGVGCKNAMGKKSPRGWGQANGVTPSEVYSYCDRGAVHPFPIQVPTRFSAPSTWNPSISEGSSPFPQ